ncbi:MAG: hypothetical protein V7723_08295, partial [Sneathiella sp.]
GAVVGVQPFGGEGLSGTGPKAGGPHYLRQFMTGKRPEGQSRPINISEAASLDTKKVYEICGKVAAGQPEWQSNPNRRIFLEETGQNVQGEIGRLIQNALTKSNNYDPLPQDLEGPTGESNRLSLYGRGNILCCGDDALGHAIMALLTGNAVILLGSTEQTLKFKEAVLAASAPDDLVQILDMDLSPELIECASPLAGLALSETGSEIREIRIALSRRPGAILPLITNCDEWQDYVIERAICIDTTASGGNTALLAAMEG